MAEQKRISCVGFLALRFTDKRKLDEKVLTYRNEHDTYALFGGWYKFFDEARTKLDEFEAEYENGNDLRLYIPSENVQPFKIWHASETGREVTPLSALEDAFKDQHIAIDPSALHLTWYRSLCEIGHSRVPNSKINLTHFIIDYFTAHLTDEQRKKLGDAMAENKGIALIGKKDLTKGEYQGKRIDPLARFAL